MKHKRHWYDYLWIVSVLYLIAGFFNILFAWLGLLCFFIPLLIAAISGSKAYCNRYCGRGQLFARLGGLGMSRRKDVPRFLKSPVLPVWVFDFLFRHVFPHAVEHLPGLCRCERFVPSGDALVDVPGAVALGVPRHAVFPEGGPICLWVLQCDAHVDGSRACDHDPV